MEAKGRRAKCGWSTRVVTSYVSEQNSYQKVFGRRKNMDDQDNRIREILGKDCECNIQNALKYFEYLKTTVRYPCRLTGMEDFPWEEPYVLGGWDKKEYEKLKKDNPSYTDEYELVKLIEPASRDDEIFANVRRISDKKIFEIGLSWLECTDSENENYQLIDDYSVWHTNY
ncbi:MAG: hypothetical protein NTV04_22190 [Deltaproteobacteria bacterium]|nr:hypothetical protein [Deltaproteobacteria bacterium]